MNRKWIFSGAILAVLVLTVIFFVRHAVQARLDPKTVEAELSKSLGLNVRVERVGVNWKGNVALSTVTLDEAGTEVLATRGATVHLHFFDLLHGRVNIQSLTLDSPKLSLNSQTSSELSKLLQNKKPSGQAFPIQFKDGEFAYHALNGRSISLSHIAGNVGVTPQGVPFALKLQDPQSGAYDLTGTLKDNVLLLKGKMTNVAISEIVTPFSVNPVPEVQGRIDGTFTASGPFNKLAIETDFTQKSGFFKGNAVVTATLAPTETGAILKGKLYSDKGSILGVGDFKAFGVNFSTANEGFVFQNGTVLFPSGLVQFSGTILKNYALLVRFKSGAFDPSTLPNFSGWGLRTGNGTIDGTASGSFPNLEIKTSGAFQKLWLGEKNAINNVRLNLAASLSSGQARFTRIALHSKEASLAFAALLHWDNEHNLDLAFSNLDAAPFARIFHLEEKLAPISMVASGSTAYDHAKKAWKGSVQSSRGMVAGESFDRFAGNFSYEEKEPIQFSGTFYMKGKTASVSGTWKQGEGNLKLDAAGFPIQNIPLLRTTAAGFHGIADVHATFSTSAGAENKVQFSLPQATYHGRSIPAVDGTISMKENLLSFSPLRFTGLNPPLSVTGKYNLKSKGLELTADLKGQDPKNVISLFSPTPLAMGGNLYGPARISGTYPDLSVYFQGDVRNVRFQSFAFDRGSLTLQGKLPNRFGYRFQTDRFSLSDFALAHRLIPGLTGTGTLQVASTGENAPASISFSFNRVSWNGKQVGGVQGDLIYHGSALAIRRLTLPLTTPPLSFSGEANLAAKWVLLHAALNGQSIAELAKISGKSLNGTEGNLYGSLGVSGAEPNFKLSFVGKGKNLHFNGMDLGDADLNLAGTPSGKLDIRASGLSASRVSTLQKAFPGMSGELGVHVVSSGSSFASVDFQLKDGAWKGKKFPSFSGTAAMTPPVTKFSHLDLGGVSPPLSASGTVNSDTHAYQFESNLNGQKAGDLTGLLGMTNSSLHGRLYGPISISGSASGSSVHFAGTGKGMKFGTMGMGSGHLEFTAQGNPENHYAVRLSASGIPASTLSLLESHFPGMTGDVHFDVSMNTANPNQASIDFGLTGASYHERSFPEVEGKCAWNAPKLEFSSLSLPKISPPLSLAGSYNEASQSLDLSGTLNGQLLSELLLLAGSTTSEANGHLYGPLTIAGSAGSPRLAFNGEVRGLAYRGVQLGNGSLNVAATASALNGKLVLDHAVSLDPSSSLIGNLASRIPGIGGYIGQAITSVEISGVLIGGTPQHPQFNPMIHRVAAQQAPSGGPFGPFSPAPQQQQQQQPSNPVFDILNQVLGGRH